MKVTKIRIENFKSIKDEITLEVKKIADKDCLILLGINESGKSNILEAISLFGSGEEVNYKIFSTYKRKKRMNKIYVNSLQWHFAVKDYGDICGNSKTK